MAGLEHEICAADPLDQNLDAETVRSIAEFKGRIGVSQVSDETAMAIIAVEKETGIRLTYGTDIVPTKRELEFRFRDQLKGLSNARMLLATDVPIHAIHRALKIRAAAGKLAPYTTPVPKPLINTPMDLELACYSPYAYYDTTPSSPKHDELATRRTAANREAMHLVDQAVPTQPADDGRRTGKDLAIEPEQEEATAGERAAAE